MANCKIRVEYTASGKVFEMETDNCSVGIERGIKNIGDEFSKFLYETGYSTITIHAEKVIANEETSKYFKPIKMHPEPYMEIW